MNLSNIREALTYDDILILPGRSSILPSEVDLTTKLTRGITLNIPILSAAMDTVTEADMAIALAQEGGLGVIHKNLSPVSQAEHVRRVKRAESGVIVDPVTLEIDSVIGDALELSHIHGVSGFPVMNGDRLAGMLTNRDYQFESDSSTPVSRLMTTVDELITAPPDTNLEEALDLLRKHRLEKLPLVDGELHLMGLITVRDIHNAITFPNACKDSSGRLRVGAAIGVGMDAVKRAEILVEAGVDCLFIDTAHGHSTRVVDSVSLLRKEFPKVSIVAGNVVTSEATKDLLEAGADGVKVGVGPGSICTTRVIAGVGCPQASAVSECASAAAEYDAPVIADGGIKYSGDIVKALAVGASSVMIGSLLAGISESPGETTIYKGRKFKVYRGMGSIGAMKQGSADRYFQSERPLKKLVPEGIEGMVPFKGPLIDYLNQLTGGLRQGMGYIGCSAVADLPGKALFVKITSAGLRESHAHDVMITKESPNYTIDGNAY
ncbi:MAG: IMP dehydrogenase [Candidatus Aegiribacteria sp.]|nr:IMP dehydrogenase [Candidatus Aegiribacteria sp.]